GKRVGSLVPDDDFTRAVLAFRNDAFERAVVVWMIFDVHRKPPVLWVERRTFGHRPRFQNAVGFQAKVVMQTRGVVLLNDKAQTLSALEPLPARLRRRFEIALSVITFERAGFFAPARS